MVIAICNILFFGYTAFFLSCVVCCRAVGAGHSLYKSQERIVLLMRAAIVFFVCFFVCFGILASVLFSPDAPLGAAAAPALHFSPTALEGNHHPTPYVDGWPAVGEDGTYCYLVEWC